MSVISRMLRDLEARDARAEPRRGSDDRSRHFPAGPQRRARSAPREGLRRLGPPLLALALAALAAALWWQRGPELWAQIAPQFFSGAAPAADEPAPDAAPPPARLAGAQFSGSGNEATLTLTIAGESREQPGYARRGTTLAVRVPAAAEDLSLPAPPADQQVFRAAATQPADYGTTIRLRVAEGATFDLQRDGGRLAIVGRVPAPPADPSAAAVQSPGADEPSSAPDAAATTAETGGANAPADHAAQTSEPTATPDAGSAAPSASSAAAAGDAPAAQTGGSTSGAKAGSEESRNGHGESGNGASGNDNATAAGGMRKDDRSTPAVRAQRRYREARTALREGELGRARRMLRRALELDADLHGARDLLVTLHRRADDADAARDVLARGIERAPTRLAYAKPYARLLADAGDLERAAQVLAQAAAAGREDPDFHALTAAVAQRRGRHEEAAAAYTRALELDGGSGRWWLGLGVALSAADHPGEAAAAFREARRTGTLTQRLDRWARSRIEALGQAN